MNYVVLITCIAHMVNCPIPNGLHVQYKANDKIQCLKDAKQTIAQLGYKERDFIIRCALAK